ncbi:MAG: PilZ domain-containing protein [Planctomycetia bacterium]|nr:PilZ domain-containing protein [Planctomycetia bacterium]
MSVQTSDVKFRQDPRVRLNPQSDVRVTLQPLSDPEKTVTGRLVDLSVTGAKMMVDGPLTFNEQVTVRIEAPEAGLDVSLAGSVCWMRCGSPHEGWTLGCAFDPELSPETMEEFCAGGLFDRRTEKREPARLKAKVRWELQTHVKKDVELVNVSRCGFCLAADAPTEVGRRLRLFVERPSGRPLEIAARTQYQFAADGKFLIGCHVIPGESEAAIEQLAAIAQESVCDGADGARRPTKGRLLFYLVAVALAAAAAALTAMLR